MKALWGLIRLVVLLVAVQAIREQLSQPPEDRTWFGRIGPVPYDFRVPSLERLQTAYWNPDDDRLFSDRVFGIGWAVNFAQLLRIVRELQDQQRQMSAR